jgi:nucleoside 2-deoxyribosyltransferase
VHPAAAGLAQPSSRGVTKRTTNLLPPADSLIKPARRDVPASQRDRMTQSTAEIGMIWIIPIEVEKPLNTRLACPARVDSIWMSMTGELIPLYLAGPDVFLPNALAVRDQKVKLCRHYGFEGLFPLSVSNDPKEVFNNNIQMMNRAKIGLFNLTPFRGVSADAGTVFELGYMHALWEQKKIPLFGYTNDQRFYRQRVLSPVKKTNVTSDSSLEIEDYGLHDNLMIDKAISKSGGFIVSYSEENSLSEIEALPAFAAFEKCLTLLNNEKHRMT